MPQFLNVTQNLKFKSSMKDYSTKTAYITGGSSGIGLSLARELVKRGAKVVLIARNRDRLEHACNELESLTTAGHRNVSIVSLDVSNIDQAREMLPKTVELSGAPDILVNSAGIAYSNYFEKIPYEKFIDMVNINLIGTWNSITVLEPFMRNKGGSIVNVSSIAGFIGTFGYTAYSASKFGVIGLSEALRGELKRYGIRVSVLCPPDTDTPQLVEENKTKPAETEALSGKSKPMSSEAVAKACIRGLEKGKFMNIPGSSGKMIYLAKRLFPSPVNWMMDVLIQRAQRDLKKNSIY
jgi:3-dehydrosphinganine reductase